MEEREICRQFSLQFFLSFLRTGTEKGGISRGTCIGFPKGAGIVRYLLLLKRKAISYLIK